jgi:hypothetical protein
MREAIKLNDSLMEMEEIKCVTENKEYESNTEENKEKYKFIEDNFYEPLFDGLDNAKSHSNSEGIKSRSGCGSIRKNKIQNEKVQDSTEIIVSPKFSSISTNVHKITEEIPKEAIGMITSREEKILVDKYLKGEYRSKNYNFGQ